MKACLSFFMVVQIDQAYFWATHQGAELDLLLAGGPRRIGIEVKRGDAPSLTASMRIAPADLRLDHLSRGNRNNRRARAAAPASLTVS
jgi:hypothetical protein